MFSFFQTGKHPSYAVEEPGPKEWALQWDTLSPEAHLIALAGGDHADRRASWIHSPAAPHHHGAVGHGPALQDEEATVSCPASICDDDKQKPRTKCETLWFAFAQQCFCPRAVVCGSIKSRRSKTLGNFCWIRRLPD